METLYNQLLEIVKAGDEPAARSFLETHLTEFPEDLQKQIVFVFFEESIDQEVAQKEALAHLKDEETGLLKRLEQVKKDYLEAQKIEELREALSLQS